MSIELRPARVDEATLLSDLALRSKGHWPYGAEFLAACRAELTYTPAMLADDTHHFVVAAGAGSAPVGFVLLIIETPVRASIDALFIAPEAIGRGLGKALWQHAVGLARERGVGQLHIHSDPYAEPFYRAMGATRIGEVASGSVPGRTLPHMRFDL